VVAVANRVGVADLDDRDRRQDGAAVLGQPDALPAAAGRRARAELAIELRGAVGLERRADRVERDLARARGASI
jgi:hypothetical protein